ncbi:MAG: prephenate dehydrogenase, partial [Candidatus Dormibacteraeota bacterium]|nr:prephenate dehydrogenase [Candidatus Dormibacteraeota bacterium]
RGEQTEVTVVAVPPRTTAAVIAERLELDHAATVTDTASIKCDVQRALRGLLRAPSADEMSRYIGGHPLAGRERGGPQHAQATLFAGRAWVLTPDADTTTGAVEGATWLVRECGATPVLMSAGEHDAALALTSHLPQLVASALAARLVDEPDSVLQLVGQGLRDMTRIAAADPALWTDIASGNAGPVAAAIEDLVTSLQRVATALRSDGAGADTVRELVDTGRVGHGRLPGKHGGAPRSYHIVGVLLEDRPGEMARLLADTAAAGVNVEDLRVEHSPGLPVGLIELFVGPESSQTLRDALARGGWRLVDDDESSSKYPTDLPRR